MRLSARPVGEAALFQIGEHRGLEQLERIGTLPSRLRVGLGGLVDDELQAAPVRQLQNVFAVFGQIVVVTDRGLLLAYADIFPDQTERQRAVSFEEIDSSRRWDLGSLNIRACTAPFVSAVICAAARAGAQSSNKARTMRIDTARMDILLNRPSVKIGHAGGQPQANKQNHVAKTLTKAESQSANTYRIDAINDRAIAHRADLSA